MGIYQITSPSGKIYIGSSKNIERRVWYYSKLQCKNQPRLYNSLNKYGWEGHKLTIVEECNFEELYERERYWGDSLNVLGENGLNSILPKAGENKKGVSDETRLKMSISKRGILNSSYGVPLSDKHKEAIRKAQTGRKHSQEHRKKVSENNAKNLAKIVIDLKTGIFFESAKEAAEAYGIKHSTLISMLNGTNKNRTNLIYVDNYK